jgi:hypothetical protein
MVIVYWVIGVMAVERCSILSSCEVLTQNKATRPLQQTRTFGKMWRF